MERQIDPPGLRPAQSALTLAATSRAGMAMATPLGFAMASPILDEWHRRVLAEIPASAALDSITVLGAIPTWLQLLLMRMSGRERGGDASGEMRAIALAHGEARAALGTYGVVDLITEVQLLAHAVRGAFETRPGSGATSDPAAFTVLNDVLDVVLRDAVEGFVHRRNQGREVTGEGEGRFKGIANALPQIIWTADAHFTVNWYNEWWFEYLGLPHGTRWDDPDTQPMHPEDVAITKARLREAVANGSDFLMEQRFRRGSDGEYRWHLVRGVAIRDDHGVVMGWIGANTDIHEQKVLVCKLEEERESRERFVASLTHDLRTPLAAARMGAELLTHGGVDPEFLAKVLPRIAFNVDRVDKMICDLLDVTRINAGERLWLDVEACDLESLCRDVLVDLAAVHGSRFALRAEPGCHGFWDCGGVRRILENLCSNAVKYGAADAPVTVALEKARACGEPNTPVEGAPGGKAMISLSVHNEGPPIPEREREGLFRLFHRSASARSGGPKGWGVGLTLVQGLAESHGGSVDVESTETGGTTFSVRLPLDARIFAQER